MEHFGGPPRKPGSSSAITNQAKGPGKRTLVEANAPGPRPQGSMPLPPSVQGGQKEARKDDEATPLASPPIPASSLFSSPQPTLPPSSSSPFPSRPPFSLLIPPSPATTTSSSSAQPDELAALLASADDEETGPSELTSEQRADIAQSVQDTHRPKTIHDTSSNNPNVIFGHGYIEQGVRGEAPTAKCHIVVYGPPGSTLARGVAKWVRERGKIGAGQLRSLTNSQYEKICREIDPCPSQDRELWEKAKPIPYPSVFVPGDILPRLRLERDTEEHVSSPNIITTPHVVKRIGELQQGRSEADALYWTACQQIGDEIRDGDLFVVMDPELVAQVYPPTASELANERRYQQRHASSSRASSSLMSSPPTPSDTFTTTTTTTTTTAETSTPAAPEPSVDPDEQRILSAFPPGPVSVTKVRAWAAETKIITGKVMRILKSNNRVLED